MTEQVITLVGIPRRIEKQNMNVSLLQHESDHGDTDKHFHAIATICKFCLLLQSYEICFRVHRPLLCVFCVFRQFL